MKYTTKILTHETARLMIGIDPPADPHFKPSLVRHHLNAQKKGGELFAFDEMRHGQIELAADECPGDLLNHRTNHLTDAQLRTCARNDPDTAFGIRHLLPPERHAIVLSITYLQGFPGMFRSRLPGFQEEVESSIASFPEPWLNAHQDDFDQLFKMLDRFLQMLIDSEFKARLLNRIPAMNDVSNTRTPACGPVKGQDRALGKRRFRSRLPAARAEEQDSPMSPSNTNTIKNKPVSKPMTYTIRKTSRTTARIAIESSASLDPIRKPEICSFYPKYFSYPAMSMGAVLGRVAGKTCALVVHVRRRDLICIQEKLLGVEDPRWRYFRIGSEFELLALDVPNRCLSKRECAEILEITDKEELARIDFKDQDLRDFLAQKHPAWLQEIVNRQILHWHDHMPDKFFRLAPLETAGRDIPRCVKESPFAALARLQDRLNKTQMALSLLNSPKAAVMFATDRIPPLLREVFLIDHAKEALLYAADKLTDKELGLCASIDLFTAFRCRTRMEPDRRAILLSHSYLVGFFENYGGSMSALQNEIRISIMEYPKQWRDSVGADGFPAILKGLKDHVDMEIDPVIINTLFEKAEPEDQITLADFIAASI